MTAAKLDAGAIDRHLAIMRRATIAFLVSVPAAVAAVILIPSRSASVSPLAVTLVAAASALWIGFTANRDAEGRVDRIKRAYAATGDETRLLRDHRLVHLTVLARLEVMVMAGMVAGIWGSSSAAAWGILALACMMMALTWPTAEKTHTLLERAREQRGRA
jgi:hypothetical protein